ALESSKPASELEASEEYEELLEEIEELESDAEAALQTDEDFESAFRDLE
ncbi:MAG: HalX domain-containing protein, partial [Halodesulfurarchaeum sp.]